MTTEATNPEGNGASLFAPPLHSLGVDGNLLRWWCGRRPPPLVFRDDNNDIVIQISRTVVVVLVCPDDNGDPVLSEEQFHRVTPWIVRMVRGRRSDVPMLRRRKAVR